MFHLDSKSGDLLKAPGPPGEPRPGSRLDGEAPHGEASRLGPCTALQLVLQRPQEGSKIDQRRLSGSSKAVSHTQQERTTMEQHLLEGGGRAGPGRDTGSHWPDWKTAGEGGGDRPPCVPLGTLSR